MRQNEILNKSKEVLAASEKIAEYGCYFMSLCYAGFNEVAEKKRELLYSEILSNYENFVEADIMDKDCFVKDPCAILSYYTGNEWEVKKSFEFDPNADIAIALWYNKRTGFHHFVLMYLDGTVQWDPIYKSKTVEEGVIESWRLFYKGKKITK